MKLCYDSISSTDKEKNYLSLEQFVKKIQYTGIRYMYQQQNYIYLRLV